MTVLFAGPSGLDVPAVTIEQMRDIDRVAIEETGPNLYQMMENAGRHLAYLTMETLGSSWDKAKVTVLAGKGGNGGGGLCAARHLANRNVRVMVVLLDKDRLGRISISQYRTFKGTAGLEVHRSDVNKFQTDIIIDALVGYSLRSTLDSHAAHLVGWANESRKPIIALDVPSGVNAATGDVLGAAIRPTRTMTLALPKTGLAPRNCGELFLADIGIPKEAFETAGIQYSSPFDQRFIIPLKMREVERAV